MFIIPIFIPHMGCPHQCIFCNQISITGCGPLIPTSESLKNDIDRYLTYNALKKKPVQIAFYGGNFLGLGKEKIVFLLNTAAEYVVSGKVSGLRFSTRPDTINKQSLEMIKAFPVATVELGVQSMDDNVLAMSHRGHTALDTENAVCLLKENKYDIGLQMMVGLPGDNGQAALKTAEMIVSLSPDFVRIYPTVVLSGSPLYTAYRKGIYSPMDLELCVALVKKIYLIFKENNIKVIRMGLQASEELNDTAVVMAGPYHPAFGQLVLSEIFMDKALEKLEKNNNKGCSVAIRVHPSDISNMRGQKNRNIVILKERFNLKKLIVLPDESLTRGKVKISYQ